MSVRRGRAGGATAVVLSTAGARRDAERLAAALVDERLAACVNLVAPLTSIYRWQGAIERAREVLLIVKTRRALVPRVTARIRALHGYDVPEVLALPVVGGSPPYLAWLLDATAEAPRARARSTRGRTGRAPTRRARPRSRRR